MQIKEEILEYTRNLFAIHQIDTLVGTYDGTNATITVTFVNDPNVYEFGFTYVGAAYNEFREAVIGAVGAAVQSHIATMGIPSREPFIDSVTE